MGELKRGTNAITTVKRGANQVQSIYRGATLIWQDVDPDAQAFITAANITDATQKTAINTLVKSLKSNSLWTKMKAIYPFVGGTATTHKFNLKDPRDLDEAYRIIWSGGVTHDANGVKGNGTNGFGDTKYNPFNDATVTNTNFSFGVYVRSQVASNDSQMGQFSNSAGANLVIVNFNGLKVLFRIMNSTDTQNPNTSNVSKGFTAISTLATNVQKVYRNGSLAFTGANTTHPNKLNSNVYVCSINGISLWSAAEIPFVYMSQGLDDTESANLYTIVNAYQVALSRNV